MIKSFLLATHYPLSIVNYPLKECLAVSFFLLCQTDASLQVGVGISIPSFHFFDGGIQEILACREEGGDGLLRACRKLVGVSGSRRDVEVVVAEAVVFHDDVFVHPREASTSADTMPVRPLPDEQWITTG